MSSSGVEETASKLESHSALLNQFGIEIAEIKETTKAIIENLTDNFRYQKEKIEEIRNAIDVIREDLNKTQLLTVEVTFIYQLSSMELKSDNLFRVIPGNIFPKRV